MSAAAQETPAAAAPAKAGPGLPVLAGVLGGMLAAGFALTYFVLPARLAAVLKSELEAAPAAPAGDHAAPGHGEAPAGGHDAAPAAGGHGAPAEGGHGAPAGGHGAPAEGGHGAPAKAAEDFVLDGIVVNVAGSRTGRFIKVSLAFDAPPEVHAELASQRSRVTDLVSGHLAAKPEEQLRAPTARGTLRTELVGAVNALLTRGEVRNVFFLEFLIQP